MENSITTIENLSGTKIETLFLEGKLDHLKDQPITSKQIMEMKRARLPEMAKVGLIHTEKFEFVHTK